MRTSTELFIGVAVCAMFTGLLRGQATGTETEPADAPPVIVPATLDTAEATIRLRGIEKPEQKDLAAGLLENEFVKERHIVPKVTLIESAGQDKDWDVKVKLDQLIPFGESKVALLYKGEKKATLRFYKAGLVIAVPAEGGFTAREGSPLTLELKNQIANNYEKVRLRLRFQDLDVCQATTDRFEQTVKGKTEAQTTKNTQPDCQDAAGWAAFKVPRYASVTVRINPAEKWFRDPQTGFARKAKLKGVLTLQFVGEGSEALVHEQSLPLEVQFEPGSVAVLGGLARVGLFLLLGALSALCLRVVIPNYRRKKTLKEQLRAVAKATRGISDEVPSVLRVLLRVEQLTLDEMRRSGWVAGWNFPEAAQRVDQGLATLKRKVELARRLDTALSRLAILQQGNVPPTRLDAIERHLSMACEALKRDQLLEQDWVFIQQKLEAADKLLGEPSQEEKDAFDALLVQRWKSITEFFRVEGQALVVPDGLKGMEACFPSKDGLPKEEDKDGAEWVKTIGATRADLQLSSLEVMRDLLFLAPSTGPNEGQWAEARNRLAILLATPAIENLKAARQLLDELAEGVNVTKLTQSLCANAAVIEVDPQSVASNEKVRLRVRFRDDRFQTAAARQSIKCEWEFRDRKFQLPTSTKEVAALFKQEKESAGAQEPKPAVAATCKEYGWEIYHYFESDIRQSDITVRFYLNGKVLPEEGEPIHYTHTVQPQAQASTRNDKWERVWQVFPEALQILAALLVPIAALAVSQANEGTTGRWWELVGIGFGSETIRNILTGAPSETTPQAAPPK